MTRWIIPDICDRIAEVDHGQRQFAKLLQKIRDLEALAKDQQQEIGRLQQQIRTLTKTFNGMD